MSMSMTMIQQVHRHRYRSLLAVTAALTACGIGTGSQTLLVTAVVPLLFVLQDALATKPSLTNQLSVERKLSPKAPLPGQPVSVTLTIMNTGDSTIPDLRVADGVPTELGTIGGDPRASAILRAGQKLTVNYSVNTNRGTYEFDPVQVRARNRSGTIMIESKIAPSGQSSLESRVSVDDIPLSNQTMNITGPVTTETGGSGIEFYATREYQTGDPIGRINWNQYAKTGQLSTIEYHEQRAVRIAIIIDSRVSAHVSSQPSLPTGATLCAYAATLSISVLLDEGHTLTIVALGTPDPIRSDPPPAHASTDEETAFGAHAAMICNAAATGSDEMMTNTDTDTDTSAVAGDGGIVDQHRLLSRLDSNEQVLFCTPALDDAAVSIAQSIRADGHELTVLSPQISNSDIGGRIAHLNRTNRLFRIRRLGGTIVDWKRNETLPIALSRALRDINSQ